MPISDQNKWSSGVEFSGALGSAGTTFTTVTVGTVPATALNANPVLYIGWSSVLGAFDLGGGTYTVTLTLPDTTVLTATLLGAFQDAKNGAANGGLYVAYIADPRIAAGGTLDFKFRLINVLGAPSVSRDNGVVIGVLFDGSVVPAWLSDGGYGDHGNVGRNPPLGAVGDAPAAGTACGTFCPGALSNPSPWPVMSWVTRTENVSDIHVGIPADANWSTFGFFSSAAQAVAIAMAVMEPASTFNASVVWDTGSDNSAGPWVVARNWTLSNYVAPTPHGRHFAQILG